MAKVRGADTRPEMAVRKLAHRLGYRFRLHVRGLPGTPDLVFPGKRKVIFVHGCFWHRHEGCRKTTTPKTRSEFWNTKFDRNVERDKAVVEALEAAGWNVLIVWECETRGQASLEAKLRSFLG
jgi:DNA mismatch endonuclease, patch repair protein